MTWHECGGYLENLDIDKFERYGDYSRLVLPNADEQLIEGIYTTWKEAFWYREDLAHSQMPDDNNPNLRKIRQAFQQMPNIRKVVSVPMANERIIGNAGYPITADAFDHFFGHRTICSGYGLGVYFMLTMGLDIKCLHLVDVGITSGSRRIGAELSCTFKTLEEIHLCLFGNARGAFNGLAVCLKAASSLQKIGLHIDAPREILKSGLHTVDPWIFDTLFGTTHFPHLDSLTISQMICLPSALFSFLCRHAATLKSLKLAGCTYRKLAFEKFLHLLLVSMAQCKFWQLESFNAVRYTVGKDYYLDENLDEQWLLETIIGARHDSSATNLTEEQLIEEVVKAELPSRWEIMREPETWHRISKIPKQDLDQSYEASKKTWWKLRNWGGQVVF